MNTQVTEPQGHDPEWNMETAMYHLSNTSLRDEDLRTHLIESTKEQLQLATDVNQRRILQNRITQLQNDKVGWDLGCLPNPLRY